MHTPKGSDKSKNERAAEEIRRSRKRCGGRLLATLFLAISLALLSGCGKGSSASQAEEAEIQAFREQVDSFCDILTLYDEKMNATASGEDGTERLLEYLDLLTTEFDGFAALDFPESYSALEATASEAAEYMHTAAGAFREAFTDPNLSEESIQSRYDYALENYSRATKRIQAIVEILEQ